MKRETSKGNTVGTIREEGGKSSHQCQMVLRGPVIDNYKDYMKWETFFDEN